MDEFDCNPILGSLVYDDPYTRNRGGGGDRASCDSTEENPLGTKNDNMNSAQVDLE